MLNQYAIKLANKRNEKRLSAITELTTIMTEDQLPKLDTGQIKQEIDRDGRERERKFKNNNHTNFVSITWDTLTLHFTCMLAIIIDSIVCTYKKPHQRTAVCCVLGSKIIKRLWRETWLGLGVWHHQRASQRTKSSKNQKWARMQPRHTLSGIVSDQPKNKKTTELFRLSFFLLKYYTFPILSFFFLPSFSRTRAERILFLSMCTFVVPLLPQPWLRASYPSLLEIAIYIMYNTHAVRESKVMQHARICRYVFIIHAKKRSRAPQW